MFSISVIVDKCRRWISKAENTYVNDTSKFSIIDKGTTDDNNQIQLKSINNDKYLSADDNNSLVYNISISNNNENNAITIELEKVEGSPYTIRTTQDLKDVIDTSKQVFMYSAYHNRLVKT